MSNRQAVPAHLFSAYKSKRRTEENYLQKRDERNQRGANKESIRSQRGAVTNESQRGVNEKSTRSQRGVNNESTRSQRGVNEESIMVVESHQEATRVNEQDLLVGET